MIPIGKKSTGGTTRIITLLGTCGLLALTVIQVPGLADQWDELGSRIARHHEHEAGPEKSNAVDQITEQLTRVHHDLQSLQDLMIDASQLPNVQSELLETARSSGCQIRKVAIQSGSAEIWAPEQKGDQTEFDPLVEIEDSYSLSTEQISLSLTGSFDQTSSFLAKIREKPWMMRVTQISFSKVHEEKERLAVEATLAFVKLSKSESGTETVNWREGSRAAQVH